MADAGTLEPDATPDALDRDADDGAIPGPTGVFEANGHRVTVTTEALEGDLRRYVMTSTAPLRDGEPIGGRVEFVEEPGQMILRSGNDVLDALFALAIEEARQNSVEAISDAAFNHGQGVDCACFETGAKWNYVWTRDTAYAVDLALAMIDPSRARRSLEFKLSGLKGSGEDPQIVQDTGSGGSWPVSTDRVVWALGAREVLRFLDGPERDAFRARAYEALTHTLALDREIVFDPRDGLYRGEASFLDWREQSYPSWTASDTVHIGASKALSTNAAHAIALLVAAQLAGELGRPEEAASWRAQAEALAASMREAFWLEEAGMFASLRSGDLDPATLHKFDLLGQSLAVLHDIARGEQATRTVAAYPRSSVGPPVIWPQQPGAPIYHNRGIWPFVTAYGLLSARRTGNAAVFDRDLESLLRGAALNLSNMENFEFSTQAAWFDDGDLSGPVVNSRRQLWSVAGLIAAWIKGVFGVEVDEDGLRVRPFVTPALLDAWPGVENTVELRGFGWRGRRIDVEIILPTARGQGGGPLEIVGASLNGSPVGEEGLDGALRTGEINALRIVLGEAGDDGGAARVVDGDGDVFAPHEPTLESVVQGEGGIELRFSGGGGPGVLFNIFRDGAQVASGVSGPTWVDPDSDEAETRSHCYAVEAIFRESGHRSHHSRPGCWWGAEGRRVHEINAWGFDQTGGSWGQTLGVAHRVDWGDGGHGLEVVSFRPRWTGRSYLQLIYGNGAGPISTGIAGAVKRVVIEDVETGEQVGSGAFSMPQLGSWERWGESSRVEAQLDADRLYRVRITEGVNMTFFEHFVPYTGGIGGGPAPYNRANIAALRLLLVEGVERRGPEAPSVALDGVGDFDDFPAEQRVEPGVRLQPWSAFAMTWDAQALYVAVASEAFEDPYKPLNIYIEARASLGPAVQSVGVAYGGQTPALPFEATHLITARRLSDDGSPEGPWNGVFRAQEGQWRRQIRLEPQRQWWVQGDHHVLSLRVPLEVLGAATRLRVAAHVVNGAPGHEWKEVIPASHTPWEARAGGFFEVDLSGPRPASAWVVR